MGCCRTSSFGLRLKGKFEVEAGERRRCAMLALAEEKVLAAGTKSPASCLRTDAEIAVETSLAENFHRLAMNPADEAQAFAALIDAGATRRKMLRAASA
jgi:ParB family chromosome partitioning protein